MDTNEMKARESTSIELYVRLKESFGFDRMTQAELHPGAYPEYYGGAYLDDDFNLVICITDHSKHIEEKVRSIMGTDSVKFLHVDHSYGEIMRTLTSLNEYALDNNNPHL